MTTIVDNAIADQSFTVDAEAVAGGIADALVASAISDGWRATWLAPALGDSAPRHRVPLQTGDPGLYQGSAGIAWACLEAAAALVATPWRGSRSRVHGEPSRARGRSTAAASMTDSRASA